MVRFGLLAIRHRIDVMMRVLAAELIREKLLDQTYSLLHCSCSPRDSSTSLGNVSLQKTEFRFSNSTFVLSARRIA